MGEYADVKKNKIKKFLKWLASHNRQVEIKKGGKHNKIIKYVYGERPFPIPLKHNVVNKYIIKDLMKTLTKKWKICTKKDFDKKIK